MSLLGLFRRGEPPDGAAPSLERLGLAAVVSGSEEVLSAGRRERQADAGADVVAEALGSKILHGWLQNRHQTLMPLSLNLRQLSAVQRSALAQAAASLLLAGRPAREAAEHAPAMRAWLQSMGADDATLACFDAALDAPLALNVLFDRVLVHELTVYAFVAALMASDTRFPVSELLPDLVRARFDLASAAVRSAIRRYRR